ncbi:MAG TPA: hemolysin family protein [Gemmatimonadales bacterium]|nr:hemolysin family protein [Gemmatimonadales bacterium]
MIWGIFALGLLLAAFGSTAGGALLVTSRSALARIASAQLRGEPAHHGPLDEVEELLMAASTTTSLGVLLLGASLIAGIAGGGRLVAAAVLLLVGVPAAIMGAYLLPRWVTARHAEGVAEFLLPVLRPWGAVLRLLLPDRTVWSEQRFRAIAREGAAIDPETTDELTLVGGVLSFAERPVREVMTPRTNVVAIAEELPRDEIVQVFAQSGYSRIPVYRGSLDEIIGMLLAFDLFKLDPGSPLPVRPVAMAPASRACGQLLVEMQRERRLMAVVLDEYGGTAGVVTLDDLLETIVGEITDEGEEPAAAAATASLLEADGSTSREAIEEHFDVTLPASRSATIGGLVAELAGRIPNPGERFLVGELELDVLQASPTRVDRLLVRPVPPPAQRLQERHG